MDDKDATQGGETQTPSTADPNGTGGTETDRASPPASQSAVKARPVAKAIVKKPGARAGAAKIQPAKVVAKAIPVKKAVAKARPVAKAIVKAAPKKVPVPQQSVPEQPASVPAVPEPASAPATAPTEKIARPPQPVAQVVARPEADPQLLMRRALRAHGEGKLDEASDLYGRILSIDPEFAPAWINLGVLLRRIGKLNSAVTCLKRGIALKPNDGPAWSNLGNALRAVNRLDDAIAAQRRALDLSSDVARIHYNYGLTVRDKGDLTEAGNAIRRASLLGYDAPELPWDQSLTQLLSGNLAQGFQTYESRWKLPEIKRLHTNAPDWDGAPLDGKTLLVWAEQGMGDTLQFCRYVIDSSDGIAGAGGKIILEVQAPLARILQRSPEFSKVTVIPRGTRLPKFDFQVPLLSLPRLLGTTLDSIPDHCPYILPPPDAEKPAGLHPERMKVGLCWAGKPSHKNDRNRSVSLEECATLFDLPKTDFVSLQKGPAVQDIANLSLGPLLRDLGSGFRDFADTAAAIRALDLVITVDTSVAHLAGAMARPVWVLLPYAPDWRWMLHRDDSPWYPSMTLFRQTSPGDWSEVFSRVRHALIRKLRMANR
ncbi:tetratricopeptide repeat protein [Pacificispira sp.]|uniref:tetratricopeptide repeat protein n=1 Tax=Pacificispira sp. TaxID=2888761 RepID=UPI003B52AF20